MVVAGNRGISSEGNHSPPPKEEHGTESTNSCEAMDEHGNGGPPQPTSELCSSKPPLSSLRNRQKIGGIGAEWVFKVVLGSCILIATSLMLPLFLDMAYTQLFDKGKRDHSLWWKVTYGDQGACTAHIQEKAEIIDALKKDVQREKAEIMDALKKDIQREKAEIIDALKKVVLLEKAEIIDALKKDVQREKIETIAEKDAQRGHTSTAPSMPASHSKVGQPIHESNLTRVGGKPLVELVGHTGHVRELAISPDKAFLATAAFDGTMKLWDVATGKLLLTGGHLGNVNGVAFSPSGDMVASASDDRTVRLWSTSSGGLVRTLDGHAEGVRAVAFCNDLLASISSKAIHVWNATSGTLLRTLLGHDGDVSSASFSADCSELVSGSYDKSVRLWSVATGENRTTMLGHWAEVLAVAMAPDQQTIASASNTPENTVRLWDRHGKYLRSLAGHTYSIFRVAFLSDGRHVISGSHDGYCVLWDALTGAVVHTISSGIQHVCSISADLELVAYNVREASETVRLAGLADM